MENQVDMKKFKIIVVGNAGVGKTMLLNRFVKGTLPKNSNPTIGVEYQMKEVTLKNEEVVRAQLWDTGNQNMINDSWSGEVQVNHQCVFIQIDNNSHYRKSVGALLIYDVTNEQSFIDIQKWLEETKQHAESNVVIMLVGNKIDLTDNNPTIRKVQIEDAKYFAFQNNLIYEESSAITAYNVDNMFKRLLEEIYSQQNNSPHQMNNNYILFNENQKEPRKKCC